MSLIAAVIVYLLSQIILQWPSVWQVKVLCLVFLVILVLLGVFVDVPWSTRQGP